MNSNSNATIKCPSASSVGEDAAISSSSDPNDSSFNDLTTLTAALLLTADCMGTGILALPADLQTLGLRWGLGFLVMNLPINLYAGSILSNSALFAEQRIL